jgi:dihydrofolate reductase
MEEGAGSRRYRLAEKTPHRRSSYRVACRVTVLGSGSIVTQFAQAGLVYEYQVMVDPVVLGAVAPIFKGLKHKLDLKLISTRAFKSGVVLLCYQLVEKAK